MSHLACTSDDPERLIRMTLDQIADKWSVLVMAELCRQPLRFNQLRRTLNGITQKSLTQVLRRLERSGLIARRVIPLSPVAVEYSITPLGQTLVTPFQALFQWASDHKDEIESAQKRFDAEQINGAEQNPPPVALGKSDEAGARTASGSVRAYQ